MVTCRTCNPEVIQRRRFDSAPGHCRVTTLGKLFTHNTHVPLSPSSIIWYRLLTGVWLRALGNGDQRRPMGRRAWEGLYVYCFTFYIYVLIYYSVQSSLLVATL